MAKKHNILDLFCGCGGLSYGFSMAGYDVVMGIDNDEASTKSFVLNHKNSIATHDDINKITGRDIKRLAGKTQIDIIVGGPPCQGFSLSGPRNFNDPRNKLYLSFIRLVEDLRPRAFLIENVPGISSLYDGQIKEQIIRRFNKAGYNISCSKLNAAEYGVPQLRNRFLFVGLLNKYGSFKYPDPLLDKKDFITAGDAIGDLPSLENDPGYDPMPYGKTLHKTQYQEMCRKGSEMLHNHIVTEHSDKTIKIISHVPEGGNYKDLPRKYLKSRKFHVAWTRLHSKKPSFTIDTGHRHHFHYRYNRVPTVRECARLQSFPDRFIFCGNKSEQYKQVGNAVPPLLAKAVADKLKEYL